MTYRFALCDDAETDARYAAKLVSDWAEASGHTVLLDTFPSAEAFLFHYAEEKRYDVLLLDIELGGMDGVKLARTVRQDNKEVQIVFLTGYMDYIADGYDVEALHYLLKPVTAEKLSAVLDRACERAKRAARALLLRVDDEMIRVPLYEIRYVEVMRNYVTVHTRAPYVVKRTLSDLARDLDEGFFRAGRSYLVHLPYVQRASRTQIFLKDGTALPLARGLYDALQRAMIEYF